MKAIGLKAPGGAIESLTVPEPSVLELDVKIRVEAIGLNPVDYKSAENPLPDWTYPHILGADCAGTIVETGKNVTRLRVGDRVMVHNERHRPGTFAEFYTSPEQFVSKLPDSLSLTDAATIPCAGLTAYQILFRRFSLRPKETILIHAGAGGVGSFAIQLARLQGLNVITTASKDNHEYVRELGANVVIDYRSQSVEEEISSITGGKGVRAIIDLVDSKSAESSLRMLSFGGHLACVVGLPRAIDSSNIARAITIHDIALGAAYVSGTVEEQNDVAVMGEELAALVATGQISVPQIEMISFENIPDGLTRLRDRHVRGKLVAT